MNILKKIYVVIAIFLISAFSLDIDHANEEITFKLYINKVYADTEVITISGKRYTPPAYFTHLKDYQIDAYWYDGGNQDRIEYYEDWEDHCTALSWKKPIGCNLSNRPDLSVNGCSAPNIFHLTSWNQTFNASCNHHDNCYIDPNVTRSECDTAFRNNMFDQCSNSDNNNSDPFFNSRCTNTATEYYLGVRALGQPYYDDAKKDRACADWIDKTKNDCY